MKAPETYIEYLKRVSGFADFKALTEEEWRKEVGVGTISTSVSMAGLKLQTPIITPNVWSQFIPAEEPEDNIDTCLMCGVEVPPGPDFCSKECEEKTK